MESVEIIKDTIFDFERLSFYFVLYYIAINIYSYVLTGYDKYKARKKRYRTSENKFFAVSLIGGALGVVMGMTTFRHKTQHKSFYWGVPGIFVFNVICIFLLFRLI